MNEKTNLRNTPPRTPEALEEYFDRLRFHPAHHLGMEASTVIAMQDSRGPDDEDYYRMKRCFEHGRMYQNSTDYVP